MITTKCTRLGPGGYGCRVFLDGALILEGRCASRALIGPTFRDLLRTLDKCGAGNAFTHAARFRNSKPGNLMIGVKHIWHR